jgi:hypothetical protein
LVNYLYGWYTNEENTTWYTDQEASTEVQEEASAPVKRGRKPKNS